MTTTLIGEVTDATPEVLCYGERRGYVEIDAETGEWLRDLSAAERAGLVLGAPVYSVEYGDLRPVLGRR